MAVSLNQRTPSHPAAIRYRSDIDGLRALAIIPVILFHAGLPGFGGGFIGVDIFFVISGFLIFGIIDSEIGQGKFSILGFYERRCRRILPALYLVIVCTLPFVVTWTFPFELHEYLRSIQAAVTFRSNFFFSKNTEYFSPISDEKPLLHTWSLSVEEQFYLIFPILLFITWKLCKKHRITAIVAGALLMFLVTEATVLFGDKNPSKLFFSTPYRSFELLFGAVAFALRQKMGDRYVSALSLLGLIMLFLSFVLLSEDHPFPSHFTLAPVMGTALVLLFGSPVTWPCRALGHPSISFIGKLSYGAYLWHVPLIALLKTRSVDTPSVFVTTIVALSSLPLAYISWRFVEMPIRLGSYSAFRSRACVFALSILGAASLFLASWVGTTFIPDPKDQRETADGCSFDQENCFKLPSTRIFFWGDSYADAFASSLGRVLNARGEGLELSIRHGCPSLLGVQRNGTSLRASDTDCTQHNNKTFEYIKQNKFKVVILTSNYAWYGDFIGPRWERPLVTALDDPTRPPADVITLGLQQTVARLRKIGIRIVVVTPHPNIPNFAVAQKEIKYDLKSQIYGDYASASYVRSRLIRSLDEAGLPFDEVNGLDWFCDGSSCPMVRGGEFALFDGSHLSKATAPTIADKVAAEVERVLSREAPQTTK
ncbi:acyltransferase family protein [Pleomorphomonas carboxyditropha]|uniref:acyltransferase family protein n=1 Tax=Pleomorphomonas carboxyditropha TaxID=2023338 RepID=UPI0013FE3DEB|nr:acyltransferase family protein [Pleomorphomonas carboxyditropha]